MGLAPPNTDYELTNDRDPFAPAKFTAGWYYGISGYDMRHEIVQCFQADSDLTNILYDGMEAYIRGDTKTGDSKFKEAKPYYQ